MLIEIRELKPLHMTLRVMLDLEIKCQRIPPPLYKSKGTYYTKVATAWK